MEKYTADFFMKRAIELANEAAKQGEVPVGAVIVANGEIIAEAHNSREQSQNATGHAEIIAINKACNKLGSWRLSGCTLYVTLEPCPMCAGAIINSRIDSIVYGAKDEKAGCCGSVVNLFAMPFNHRPVITQGICEEECQKLMSDFFISIRNKKNNENYADNCEKQI
jgi:Cytosine/adenosine deaminases